MTSDSAEDEDGDQNEDENGENNMDSSIEIEPATTADIDTITELWVRLARDQRRHESAVRAEPNRAVMRETLAAHCTAGGLLVARVNGDIAGFASFSIEHGTLELDTDRGTLTNLYVEPPYRDRGIGTALLEAAERRLAEQGVDVMTLEVMAQNDAARQFYRDRGYDPFRVGMQRSLDDRSENDTHSKEDG
ncbi:Ribosomal protein S18 acetylase RimI [Halobiforma haloterrestris]|uniref:Ribosomal protein S18 acetylase RimI n=1 Tax=Natronobacterium haloterrestre TaxID=148448 RepID=A0A1I1FEG0_NATHA|nr:GNAT family N-acetyltransferase [Halobiforma haloterrestris]SFB95460.1 Ribosomal protein S18 acetylase RimI [Halobiforma haloterrestris]